MGIVNDIFEFDERKRIDLKDEYTILQSRIDSYGTLIIQVRGIILALIAPTVFICYQIDLLNLLVVKIALFAAILCWLYVEMISAHSKEILKKRIFEIEKVLKDESSISNINVYELGAISRQLHSGFLFYGWKYYLDDQKNKKRKFIIKPFYKEKKIQKLFFSLLISVFVLYIWNPSHNNTTQAQSNNFYIDQLFMDSNCSENNHKVMNEPQNFSGVKPSVNVGIKPKVNMKNNVNIDNNITLVKQLDKNISMNLSIINKYLLEQNILLNNLHSCCNCNSSKSESFQ